MGLNGREGLGKRLKYFKLTTAEAGEEAGALGCENSITTRSSRPKDWDLLDFATIARSVVERAIGGKMDARPLDDPNEGKA